MRSIQAPAVALPFDGVWEAVRSPADAVPSHGTDYLAQTWAFDFVAVTDRQLAGGQADFRWIGSSPLSLHPGYGLAIHAPASGEIVAARGGFVDRRPQDSVLATIGFLLGQPVRAMTASVAELLGNHVIQRLPGNIYAMFCHLQAGSLAVSSGQLVQQGEILGRCGNSGNSTKPHLHVQLMDGEDPQTAKGVPLEFAGYEEWDPEQGWHMVERGIPRKGRPVRRAP